MLKKKLALLLVVLIIGCTEAIAQKYNIKTYSVNDGLPSSQVYDVHVDDHGYVWFATAYGLVKFDGYNFETYNKSHGLRDELLYDLFEDSNSNLWVSSETGGVGLFESGKFSYLPELSRLDTLTVQFITESDQKEIWFATYEQGIIIWNRENDSFRELTTEDGLLSNSIWDIYFDELGFTWIASDNGVNIYEESRGVFKTLSTEIGSPEYTYQVFEAQDGTKWIPTDKGFAIIESDFSVELVTRLQGHSLDFVFSISQDNDGTMWIGTESKGLFCYNPITKESVHITKKNGLSSNYIYRLVKDKEGTIWIATDGDGVSIFKDKNFKFYDISSEYGSNSVYGALKARDGTLWFGTDNAIVRYRNGSYRTFKLPESTYFEEEIWDISELPNGNLLLLTYSNLLLEFDGSNFRRYRFRDQFPSNFINDILVDGNTIWIGAEDALIKYQNGSFNKIIPTQDYWGSYINTLYKDSDGSLWLGTENGAAKFDGENFQYFDEEDGISGSSVYEFEEDRSGNIWIGTTEGFSVLRLAIDNTALTKVENFQADEAFLNETIFLQFDEHGGLWQGTNGGINYFNVETWMTTGIMNRVHFPLQEYGKGVEMNGHASLLDNNGTLWFGSARKGLISFDYPKGVKELENDPAPSTFIRSIESNGELLFDQSVKELDESRQLSLDFDENNIEFRFGAVNYKDPHRVFYKYKLQGFDEEWHSGFGINEATYTNLPAGEYEFQVFSKSVKSDWGTVPATFGISIEKPFWLSTIFFVFIVSLIVAAIVLYINIRLNAMERRDLKELVDEQTKDIQEALDEKEVLIKEIHHRVKNNLAVVSGLLELQSWKMPDGLAKKALQESKMRVLTMSKVHENLYQNKDLAKVNVKRFFGDLLKSVSVTMKQTNHNIEVVQHVEDIVIDVNLGVPLGLITNELISNCYKHAFNKTKKGVITVTFEEEEDSYKLTIHDNGVGNSIDLLTEKNDSLGMSLVKSLVAQIKAEITYSGEDGSEYVLVTPKEVF